MRTLVADQPLGVTITVDRLQRGGRHACAATERQNYFHLPAMYRYVQVCRVQVPLNFRESASSAAWAGRPAKSSGNASKNPRDSLRLAVWAGCIAALQVTLLLHVRALGVAAGT